MAKTKDTSNGECFIIMPITVPPHMLESYPDGKDHFTNVLNGLFEPAVALARFGFIPPSSDGSRVIHRDIAEKLQNAKMVLCDMSALNPNVFFELGMRTAMNKPVCLVRDSALPELPFDTGPIQCHLYNSAATWQLDNQREALAKHIIATASTQEYKGGNNAWWQVMGIDYAPASIETGGNTADLNRLKLDQIISMLSATSRLDNQGDKSLDPMISAFRSTVLDRLKGFLPGKIFRHWDWTDYTNLTLTVDQPFPKSTVSDMVGVAAVLGVSLIVVHLQFSTNVNHPTRTSILFPDNDAPDM